MSVDMYPERFRKELMKLPVFDRAAFHYNPDVWPEKIPDKKEKSKRGAFPAWRAIFSSACLWGHSSGYRLFSYEDFYQYVRKAYTVAHPKRHEYLPYFSSGKLEGMRHRISVWYESGMAEAYLYACLIEAIEDQRKVGFVLYDPRIDWKLKADAVVIVNRVVMLISAFSGDIDSRVHVEKVREEHELIRKRNTLQSSQFGNVEIISTDKFQVTLNDSDVQYINGIRLFSMTTVNNLLNCIYRHARISSGWEFPLP